MGDPQGSDHNRNESEPRTPTQLTATGGDEYVHCYRGEER